MNKHDQIQSKLNIVNGLLSLLPLQVKIWFQNHRYKLKKYMKDVIQQQQQHLEKHQRRTPNVDLNSLNYFSSHSCSSPPSFPWPTMVSESSYPPTLDPHPHSAGGPGSPCCSSRTGICSRGAPYPLPTRCSYLKPPHHALREPSHHTSREHSHLASRDCHGCVYKHR